MRRLTQAGSSRGLCFHGFSDHSGMAQMQIFLELFEAGVVAAQGVSLLPGLLDLYDISFGEG